MRRKEDKVPKIALLQKMIDALEGKRIFWDIFSTIPGFCLCKGSSLSLFFFHSGRYSKYLRLAHDLILVSNYRAVPAFS